MAGKTKLPRGTFIFLDVVPLAVATPVPVGWTRATAGTLPRGETPTVVPAVNVFTPRKVGPIIVAIVLQSQSYSVMQSTVVPNAPRPITADGNVGSLPRDPGFLGDLSVVGTAHSV